MRKVEKFRESLVDAPPPPPSDWPPKSRSFKFSYASATRITQIVKGLSSTEALGVVNIPVSVWKKGIKVLASPVAHLINRSLHLGTVPKDFKMAIVHPVHKGNPKPRSEPGSYRPVSILTALSKVLEAIVKEDLELHLDNVGCCQTHCPIGLPAVAVAGFARIVAALVAARRRCVGSGSTGRSMGGRSSRPRSPPQVFWGRVFCSSSLPTRRARVSIRPWRPWTRGRGSCTQSCC
jgi:hypothetical protein